ncbi:MAG: hypothetical protein KIS66_16900 [Fimbriimonadaceae bacterium]|nr:hypothetical protein [Fimbriimonadaceae bacterium]
MKVPSQIALVGVSLVFLGGFVGAQRSVPLGNVEKLGRLGRILVLYARDYDDCFPLAMATREDGSWRWNAMVKVDPYSLADLNLTDRYFWINACRPYGAIDAVLEADRAEHRPLPGASSPDEGVGPWVSWAYNGLLHGSSRSAVAVPGKLPVLWLGWGNIAYPGRAMANPSLMCMMPGPCRFNAKGSAQPDGLFGGAFFYTGGKFPDDPGTPFLSADLSVYHLKLGASADYEGRTKVEEDPFVYGPGRRLIGAWSCEAGPVQYPCWFRPDFEYKAKGS